MEYNNGNEENKYLTEEPAEEEKSQQYYENKKELVSRVAFLCGVRDEFFTEERGAFLPSIYRQFKSNDRAMIIRCLCQLRTSIENHFKKLNDAMYQEGRSFFGLTEYFSNEALLFLEDKGIRLPTSSRQLTDIIGEINRNINDRINNCKNLFPDWFNWDYIRDLLIMPNGQKKEGMQAAANLFYENKINYPFGVYINWTPYDVGNLFANDYKFAQAVYGWHNEVFLDTSNLSDVSESIKNRIYQFLDESEKTVLVVDCENADPYSLCAMFNCIDDNQAEKIDKIILYDDPQAPTGWRFFEQHVNINPEKIEHNLIQRILDNKSLLDVKLSARVAKEFYKNLVDSFILVSSDSDFWGLIEETPEAKFLIMIEHTKTSRELKRVLEESGIFYCYTDDFYTGMDDSLRMQAMFSEFNAFFESFRFNIKEEFDTVLKHTRVQMSESEKKQFFEKYLKKLQLSVEKDGNVRIELNR